MNNFVQTSNSGSKDKHKGKKGKQKTNKWKCYHYGKEGHMKKILL